MQQMSNSLWFVAIGGSAQGPMAFSDLRVAAACGSIDGNTLVWADGLPDWCPAVRVDGLLPRSTDRDATQPGQVAPPTDIDEDFPSREAKRLGVWSCLALAGMHALGGLASLFLKTGFLSFERLTTDQAFVSATNNMAVAVAFLAIAYLYDAKGHVLIPIFGLLLFGAEVVAKIDSGMFAPVWLLAYAALALMFAASIKASQSLKPARKY